MKNKILFLATMLVTCTIALSQAASPCLLSSAGDCYKNANYQLDWSIGELLTRTYTKNGQILLQGFHQNNYSVTAVEKIEGLQFEIVAFPNPTTDLISLKIEKQEFKNLEYTVNDMNGKIFMQNKIVSTLQTLDLSNCSAGIYFIAVKENNKSIKVFKIIKK